MSRLFRWAALLNVIGGAFNTMGMTLLYTTQGLVIPLCGIGIGGTLVVVSLILMVVDYFRGKK